ncbi:hypothetical protein HPP92_012188 [Vanilla planifolia]|uniref:F-box domain-containing protein n=1 Tax=Vanilla planifolia TaxID=51239 RepID=A0A835V2I4_VANPL|nr:hypothetical protein HPP92_012188 [Vanilla planifolia]
MVGEPADLLRSRRWQGDGLAASAGEVEQGVDHFDRLPDPILLVIFNRIGDVKVLGRCCVVSRRFHSLVPLVDNVSVRVDCVISDDPSTSSSSSGSSAAAAQKTRSVLYHFACCVLGGIVRPLQALGQILSSSSFKCTSYAETSSSEVSHHSPTEVLKNFKEIRRLRIELPAGELGVNDGVLLKWKANFGSTIDSCVILGASSVISSSSAFTPSSVSHSPPPDLSSEEDNGSIPESFYANGGLKLRVVWTISSLIAASARHYLLQPIVNDHDTLEFLDLTDADGQGVLSMDEQQLKDLRVKPVSASGSSQRTLMPALSMRLWYAPFLELSGGMVLKGATLVAIQPSEDKSRDILASEGSAVGAPSDFSWVLNAFEEPYRNIAVFTRNYFLEVMKGGLKVYHGRRVILIQTLVQGRLVKLPRRGDLLPLPRMNAYQSLVAPSYEVNM